MFQQAREAHLKPSATTMIADKRRKSVIFRRLVAALGMTVEGQKKHFGQEYDVFAHCLCDDGAFMPPSVRKIFASLAEREIPGSDLQLLREAMRSEARHLTISEERWGKLFPTKNPVPILPLNKLFQYPLLPEPMESEVSESTSEAILPSAAESTSPAETFEADSEVLESNPEDSIGQQPHVVAAKAEESVAPEYDETVTAGDASSPSPSSSPTGRKESQQKHARHKYVEIVGKISEKKLNEIFGQNSALDVILFQLCLAKGISPIVLGKRAAQITRMSDNYFSVFFSVRNFCPTEEKLTAGAIVLDLDKEWTDKLMAARAVFKSVQPDKRPKAPNRPLEPAADDSRLNRGLRNICASHGLDSGKIDLANPFPTACRILSGNGLSSEEIKYLMGSFAGQESRVDLGLKGDGCDILTLLLSAKQANVTLEVK